MDGKNATQTISQDAIKARNQYFRDWRARNKKKVQEYNARYWDKKAKEIQLNNANAEGVGA